MIIKYYFTLLSVALLLCSIGVEAGQKTNVNLNSIPKGLKIEAQIVSLKEPIKALIDNKTVSISRLIEYRVSSSEPIPARAIDPVVMVGERAVTRYRYEKPNVIVFTDYESEKMLEKQDVRFQWGSSSPRPPSGEKPPSAFIIIKSTLKSIDR
ncbi:MAG: hypothetical protein ACXW09_14065 [Methylococcaceae bacterium]